MWLPLPTKTQGSSWECPQPEPWPWPKALALGFRHAYIDMDHLSGQAMYSDEISYSGPVDLEFFSGCFFNPIIKWV